MALISTVHDPYDVRIFHKAAKTLSEAGHSVFLLSAKINCEARVGSITLIPIRRRESKIARILFSTLDVLSSKKILNYDVYHFFDPELIFAGFFLRMLGKKVVLEVMENIKGMVESRKWIGKGHVRILLAELTWFFDRAFFRCFSSIIVARPDLIKAYSKTKCVLINNYPDFNSFINIPVAGGEVYKKNKPVVLYSGGLTEIRGIYKLIEAMEILNGAVELWLVGPWLEKDIEERCRKMKGFSDVRYLGNFPYGEHYRFFPSADIGIVPFLPARNHYTTMPNKPFEYMAFRIPVLMSNFHYWKVIFAETSDFFNPLDPYSIAESITLVLKNRERYRKRAEIAYEKVSAEMNWDKEKIKLIDLYKSFDVFQNK
ncbi:MAG: glycosyltransferase [bacterium]|nr:glycosyltransferase [bacterium]